MLAEQTGLSTGWISVELISGLCCNPHSQIKDCSLLHGTPSLEVFNFQVNQRQPPLTWRMPTPASLHFSICPPLICAQDSRMKLFAPALCLKVKNEKWPSRPSAGVDLEKGPFYGIWCGNNRMKWAKSIAIRTTGWVMNPKYVSRDHKMKQTRYFYCKHVKRVFALHLSWLGQGYFLEDDPCLWGFLCLSHINPKQCAILVSLKTITRPSDH